MGLRQVAGTRSRRGSQGRTTWSDRGALEERAGICDFREASLACRLDSSGRVVFASRKLLERLGYRKEDVLGRFAQDLTAPEHRRRALASFRCYLGGQVLPPFCSGLIASDGSRVRVQVIGVPIFSRGGGVEGVLVALQDLSEFQRVRDRLASLEHLHSSLMRHLPVGVALLTPDLRVIEASTWLRRGKKLPASGQVCCYNYYREPRGDEPCPRCPALAAISDGKEHTIQAKWSGVEGELMVRLTASPVRNGGSKAVAVVEVVQDVTEQHRTQTELMRLARLDGLTKVFNRGFFQDLLNNEISKLQRYGGRVGLLYVDVDHLKVVNDRFGHAAGDEILRTVARILRENVRKSDTVARFGGDEFVVLMPRSGAKEMAGPINRINRSIARWNAQPTVPGAILSLSIGHAIATREDFQGLVEKADATMYEEKRRNRETSPLSEWPTRRVPTAHEG